MTRLMMSFSIWPDSVGAYVGLLVSASCRRCLGCWYCCCSALSHFNHLRCVADAVVATQVGIFEHPYTTRWEVSRGQSDEVLNRATRCCSNVQVVQSSLFPGWFCSSHPITSDPFSSPVSIFTSPCAEKIVRGEDS